MPQSAVNQRIIQWLIIASQRIELFRARGEYSGLGGNTDAGPLVKGEIELADSARFLANFRDFDFIGRIRGADVLDYGSGFGGRTVWMARYARHVEGVEVIPEMVERSRELARAQEAGNVRFSLGDNDGIRLPDASFDVLVTYDVLEHVAHPDVMMHEFRRLLRPGGTAVVIFTPFLGAFNHHLDYITLLPALHWIFSPPDIIAAINELLVEDRRFADLDIGPQPPPPRSFNGARQTFHNLNGMTKSEFLEVLGQCAFEVQSLYSRPILDRFPVLGRAGAALNAALARIPGLDERLSVNVVAILKRPA
jgi:SAM-dependent methyltransferase